MMVREGERSPEKGKTGQKGHEMLYWSGKGGSEKGGRRRNGAKIIQRTVVMWRYVWRRGRKYGEEGRKWR